MVDHQIKTLLLVAGGLGRSDRARLKELESNDQHPRVTFFAEALNADELDEKFLQRSPLWRRFFYNLLPVTISQVIEAFIIKKNYDAVISWAEKLSLPLALLTRITRSRIPHVAIFCWPAKGKKGVLLKYLHNEYDRLIIGSTVQAEKVVRNLGVPLSKIFHFQWPVDQQFFRPMSRTPDMICAVGSEMRDYPTLLEAMRGLPITCHIAAGTLIEKHSKWMKAVENKQELPANVTVGRKSLLELRELYARSSFVVVPLHQAETDNGITCILEAFAMGKPVICSRTRGQVDVIEEGKTGIFVPIGDSKALREEIIRLWNNPSETERMGKNARAYMEQYPTVDEIGRAIRQIVEKSVAGHPRRSIKKLDTQ